MEGVARFAPITAHKFGYHGIKNYLQHTLDASERAADACTGWRCHKLENQSIDHLLGRMRSLT